MRTTKILSVTLSPAMLEEAERVAKEENRTKSELVREALRRYMEERRWKALRAYGASRVRDLGLEERDTGRLVEVYRAQRRRSRA